MGRDPRATPARQPSTLPKIDVEGHEEDVLLGAQSLIARDRPSLMVEVEEPHNPGSIERVTRFFQSRGYCGFFFDMRAPFYRDA